MSAGQWVKKKWRKIYLKIVREKASPEYVARGWSIGMFFGCLIPMGLQLFCSIPTAFLLKGSKIGAVLGTFITNHVTVFFIYPVQCYVGAKLLGLDSTNIKDKVGDMIAALKEFSLLHPSLDPIEKFLNVAGDLAGAFFVGGAIMAIVFTPITYVAVKRMVVAYRIRVEKRRKKRLAALRARVQTKHQREAQAGG